MLQVCLVVFDFFQAITDSPIVVVSVVADMFRIYDCHSLSTQKCRFLKKKLNGVK
jgi:hypothetical protein